MMYTYVGAVLKYDLTQSILNDLLTMGHPRPVFSLFSSFEANIAILTTNLCEKIQYTVLGFKSVTFRTRFSLP